MLKQHFVPPAFTLKSGRARGNVTAYLDEVAIDLACAGRAQRCVFNQIVLGEAARPAKWGLVRPLDEQEVMPERFDAGIGPLLNEDVRPAG